MLDEAMMHNLCVRSLPRGIDSFDDETLRERDISQLNPGTSPEGEMIGVHGMSHSAPPWYKSGMYQIMPQEIENKFCAHGRCVTTHQILPALFGP